MTSDILDTLEEIAEQNRVRTDRGHRRGGRRGFFNKKNTLKAVFRGGYSKRNKVVTLAKHA